jgi:putative sensory transduction regulator
MQVARALGQPNSFRNRRAGELTGVVPEQHNHLRTEGLTMKYGSMCAAAAILVIGAPAGAQLVTAGNPQTIVQVMQDEGYQTRLGKDAGGDPMVSVKAPGNSFDIYFYGCEKNDGCTSIQFVAVYDLGKASSPGSMNEWNSRKRFATASLDDDNDPCLRMDVYTGSAGISMAAFRGSLGMWTTQLADFQKHVGVGN